LTQQQHVCSFKDSCTLDGIGKAFAEAMAGMKD
jgi:hypothetical protein